MGEGLIGDRIFFNNDKFAIDINGEVCKPTIKEDVCKCIFFYKHKEKWVRFECLLCGIENATDEKVESIKQFAKGFFIKESEKSMITDKQGMEWIFKKLYDAGWRYIVGGLGEFLYITQNKPTIVNGQFKNIGDNDNYKCIDLKDILHDLDVGEVICIAEELGIVNWSEVPVDTPIYVWDDGNEKKLKRYFAFYKDGRVHTWGSGATSWSINDKDYVSDWDYAELAEV